MVRCGHCGTSLENGALSCFLCGGTAIPSHGDRGLQPLYGVGEMLSGRFRVERILGSGASGVVYGVHDSHTERRVALKVLWERASVGDPALERLKRELRAAQHAPNPHCVTVYDLLFVQDHPAILMEWVDGETLRARILGRGALPFEEATALAEQVLEAAAHLHAVGVVHRDIKSGNVMLASDGTAKLGDFGLAKGETVGATLTETGVALGTPGYMAPEVIRGGSATPASDLYSMGAMLFEMLTGRMPFQGSSALEVASRQLGELPPLGLLRQHRVPRWLIRVTARLLERDPADRFSSAREALRAIEHHSAGFALSRRWRWRIAAASLLLAFGFAALLWGRYAARDAPIHLSFHDKVLEVRSSAGRLLWRRTLSQDIQSAAEGHFGPGGTRAVACAIQWDPSSTSPYSTNQIAVFTAAGVPLTTFGASVERYSFSQRYYVELSTHRFSRGGREKLVAYVQHATWYPASLSVYGDDAFAASDHLAGPYELHFTNSGSMQRFAFRDLDGDGTDEVICTGLNNRLYKMLFCSVLRLGSQLGRLDREPISPDVAWTPSSNALYYRLFVPTELSIDFLPGGTSGPLGLKVRSQPAQWQVALDGIRRDGVPVTPDTTAVNEINTLLPNLCSLRDQAKFRELEEALREWPEKRAQPYAWLGILFRAHALVGQGRYRECDQILKPALSRWDRESRAPVCLPILGRRGVPLRTVCRVPLAARFHPLLGTAPAGRAGSHGRLGQHL